MADEAAEQSGNYGRLRERSATRASMLAAARRVAERDGPSALSLSGVAAEAGYARATVYGYFSSKAELLSSIVAEDLNHLTRALRSVAGMPEPPSSPRPPSRVVRLQIRGNGAGLSAMPDTLATPVANEDEEAAFVAPAAIETRAAHDTLPVSEVAVRGPASVAEAAVEATSAAPKPTSWTAAAESDLATPAPVAGSGASLFATKTHQVSDSMFSSDAEDETELQLPAVSTGVAMPPEEVSEVQGEEETSEPSQPIGTASKLQRIPQKDERIILVGPRTAERPELREMVKKLGPANPSGGETQSETITRLREAVAKFEAAPQDRVEQRFARFERALNEIEERFVRNEEAGLDTSSAFRESLSKIGERIDENDTKHRDSVAKIMIEIRDAARRLEELEFFHRMQRMGDLETAQQPQPQPEAPAVEPTASETAATPEAAEAPPDTEAVEKSAEPEKPRDQPASYLAATRAALIANAASSSQHVESDRSILRSGNTRTRVLLGGLLLVAVGIAVTGFVLKRSAPTAPRHAVVAMAPVPHRTTRIASAGLLTAPLDRITARANAGDTEAELVVGLRYLGPEGLGRQDALAFDWLTRASAKGDARAEYWLGYLYQHGRGTTADPVEAFSWYQKAAAQGHRKAMHNLAIAYAQGQGTAQDFEEAARWFLRAANLGYVDSAFNLAVLYERGDGVPQSLLDAYKWYGIAAQHGDTESSTRMGAIANELSNDDRAAADKAIAAFQPEPLKAQTNVDPAVVVTAARAHQPS